MGSAIQIECPAGERDAAAGAQAQTASSANEALPEKRWVRRSFSRAALDYDKVAVLQRQVAEQLLAQLQGLPSAPKAILDVGAGTGYCTARLAEMFPGADLLALDIAEGMLRTLHEKPDLRGRARRVCGDAECLPLKDASVDLVFSNLAVQWCADLPSALAEFRRVLRPGGRVLFSSFGAATLRELRDAWAQADAYTHVNAFASRESVEAALVASGCGGWVRSEQRLLSYRGVDALLRELKSLGAHNVTANRPRHLTGKGVFRKMLEAYAIAMAGGSVMASFEIIYAAGGG